MQKNIVGCPFQVLILRLIVVYCMHVAYAPLHTRPIDEFLITDEMAKKNELMTCTALALA